MRVYIALMLGLFAGVTSVTAETAVYPQPRPDRSEPPDAPSVAPLLAVPPVKRPSQNTDAVPAVEGNEPGGTAPVVNKMAPPRQAPRTLPPVKTAPVSPDAPLPEAIRKAVEAARLLAPLAKAGIDVATVAPMLVPDRNPTDSLPFSGAVVENEFAPLVAKRPRPRRFTVQRVSTRAIEPRPSRPLEPVGRICGDARLIGQPLRPIQGKLSACGIDNPVKVSTVSGVKLRNPITVNCKAAKSLAQWLSGSVKSSAVSILGSSVVEIRPVASYACRTRNNRPGAKLSEHAKGNAIDIAAFTLADGRTITVLQGWRRKTLGTFLRKIHSQACGPFGTVLGPNSDTFHQDHFHLDVARYRSGAYCR